MGKQLLLAFWLSTGALEVRRLCIVVIVRS